MISERQSPASPFALLILGGLLVLLYAPIVRDMAGQWWEDPNYSHGFLIPLFSAYVVWERRERLREALGEGSGWGLVLMLLGLGGLVLGVLGAENFLMRSSLVVVVAGLILFHCGRQALGLLAFPLGFLLFMIPLPAIVFNAIAFPLQGFAAENATRVLDQLGVPVLRDGNVIHLSQITLGVTEACSGIRSLVSLLALAVVWAYVTLPGLGSMSVLVAAAVPITIIANAGRIVLTALIGQWFGVEYAKGFFHAFSGWLIFIVAFLCLLGVHGAISLVLSRFPAGSAERR